GVDPNNPPLSWEFWDEDFSKWSALRLEKDTTGGLNANGKVVLHIPHGCTMSEIDGQSACWIRCRAIEPSEGQSSYSSSPKIIGIKSDCTGGTVPTSNAQRINAEILGKSDGTSGQRFVLHNSPVLAREEGETIEVQGIDGNYEPWQEVSDFSDSGPDDPHFVCDSVSGEIQFGPAIKQPSGQELQYGKIPVNGSRIQFTSYRFGGGVIGNVGEGTITVMKSSIPYIASVVNWQAARGGTDSESMKSAKMRAPQALRSRSSAVTAEDFEYLAVEASSLVARAKCLSPGDAGSGQELLPGVVRLMLVPKISQTDRIIPEEELDLTKQIREEVHSYLDERRLLGTRLEIARPKYVPVSVEAHIRSKVNTDPATVATKIEKELYRYINPVCGGPDGDGWPFGRGISVSEIYATIQGTEGVDYIEELKVFPIDAETGERQSAANQTSIPADSLICSRAHEITVR
ncbi:MAG: putative baseplate assembly protein, partial [Chloroflexota bacterium]|nr:putative baseplate assembly protein [Chloroflexota bacterium]